MGVRLMFLWEFCASKNVSVDLHGFQEHRRDLTSSDDFDQGGPWVSTEGSGVVVNFGPLFDLKSGKS